MKLAPAPVTVFVAELPIVITPVLVVMARVPEPPSIRFSFMVTRPLVVEILPAFQSIGPTIVNAAFVSVAANKS